MRKEFLKRLVIALVLAAAVIGVFWCMRSSPLGELTEGEEARMLFRMLKLECVGNGRSQDEARIGVFKDLKKLMKDVDRETVFEIYNAISSPGQRTPAEMRGTEEKDAIHLLKYAVEIAYRLLFDPEYHPGMVNSLLQWSMDEIIGGMDVKTDSYLLGRVLVYNMLKKRHELKKTLFVVHSVEKCMESSEIMKRHRSRIDLNKEIKVEIWNEKGTGTLMMDVYTYLCT